jgi:hypothetical protein
MRKNCTEGQAHEVEEVEEIEEVKERRKKSVALCCPVPCGKRRCCCEGVEYGAC